MVPSDLMLYPNNKRVDDVGNLKLIFKLIRLYRANECLWNARSLGYNNVRLQENAWKRIALLLNNEFSIDELKQQMRLLCSYYKSEHYARQRQKLEGKSVETSCPYYHKLKFLNTKSKSTTRLVSGSTVFKIPIFGSHNKKPLTRSIQCVQPNSRKTLLTKMQAAPTDAAAANSRNPSKDLQLSKIHEDAQTASNDNQSTFYKLSVKRLHLTDSQIKATKKTRSVSGSDRHPNKYCTKCGRNIGTADECTICKNRCSQANSKATFSTNSRPNPNIVQHSYCNIRTQPNATKNQRPKVVSHSANGESRTNQRQMHVQPSNNPNSSQLRAHQVPAVQKGATVQPNLKLVDTWPVRKLCSGVTGKKMLLGNYNGLSIRDPTQAVKPYVPTNSFFARKPKSNIKNVGKEWCDNKWQKIKNACSRINAFNASKHYNQDIKMSCETLDKCSCCESAQRIESGGALQQRYYVDCQTGKAAEKAETQQADADRILIACTLNETPIINDKQTASPTRSYIDCKTDKPAENKQTVSPPRSIVCETGKTFKPMHESESQVEVLVASTSHKTNMSQPNTAFPTRSFVDCKTGKIYKAVDKSEFYQADANKILIACTSQRTIVSQHDKKNMSPARSYVDFKTGKASKPAHKSVSQDFTHDSTTLNHTKQNVETSKPNLMLVPCKSPKALMSQNNIHCDGYKGCQYVKQNEARYGNWNHAEQSEAQARNDLLCDAGKSYYERLEANDLCEDCSLKPAKLMESVSNQESNSDCSSEQSQCNTQLQPLSKQTTQIVLTPTESVGLRKRTRRSDADACSAGTTCRVSELRIIKIRHSPTKSTNKDTDYDTAAASNNAKRRSTNSKSTYSNVACETYLDLNLRKRDRPEVAASDYRKYLCDNQASCSKHIYDNTDDNIANSRISSTRSHRKCERSGSGQGSYVPTSEQAARTERILARAKLFEKNQKQREQRAQRRSHVEHRRKYEASHEASEDTLTCVNEFCNQERHHRSWNSRGRGAETHDDYLQERKNPRSRRNSKNADRSRHIKRQCSGSEAFTWTLKLNSLASPKERFLNGKHLEKQYLGYRQQAVRDKKEKILQQNAQQKTRTTKPTPNKPISRYPSKNIISRHREQRKYLHNEKMARNFFGHINFNASKSRVRLLYPPAEDFCGSKQSYVEGEKEQTMLRDPARAQVNKYPRHASERTESRRRKENKKRHD